MIPLPIEIWHHFLSFLTEPEIWKIHSTCSLIFQIAMDRRYKSVLIATVELQRIESDDSKLRRLCDPQISTRVQELAVFCREKPAPTLPIKFSQAEMRASFMDMFMNKDVAISEFLAHFSKVTSLTVYGTDSKGSRSPYIPCLIPKFSCIRVAALALYTLKDQITRLFLHWTVAPSEHIIPLSLFLPKLEVFSMCILDDVTPGNLAKMASITSFVNAHHRTIRSLDFYHPSYFHISEITTPIFRHLGHLPHLDTLSFIITEETDSKVMQEFLVFHSNTLHKLCIYTPIIGFQYTPDVAMDKDLAIEVDLPNLKDLELHLFLYEDERGSFPNIPSAMNFVLRFRTSLRRLSIANRALKHDEWSVVFPTRWPNLEALDVQLEVVTSDTFEWFGTMFPSLVSARINLSDTSLIERPTYPESRQAMLTRSFALLTAILGSTVFGESSLRSFCLDHEFGTELCIRKELAAVLHAFPSLLSVNNQSRADFMRDFE